MRILGIDPGLQHTGWGVIERTAQNSTRYIASGAIHSNPKEELPQRLLTLHNGLSSVIAQHRPQHVAIEETFVNKNALSSLKLGHARGVLMLTAQLAGLPVTEYAALLVKKSITGVGRAEKEQVAMMVKILLPGALPDSPDAADALAVALTHAHHGNV